MTPTSSSDNAVPMRQSLTVRMAVEVILCRARLPGGERGSAWGTAPGQVLGFARRG